MEIRVSDKGGVAKPMSAANAHIPASIEVSPRQVLEKGDHAGTFPAGTRVYVTDIGTHSHEDIAKACRSLKDHGYSPVPHIPARRIESMEALEAHFARLTGEAGVEDMLLIAGEADYQQGPFSSTIQVMQTGFIDKYGVKAFGVAGHPEGNPSSPEGADYDILREKAEFQKETDAAIRVVTQFGFDGEAFANWAWHVKAVGIDLPIHLGVAGPAKITTLIKYGSMSGVGNSLKFLKKRAGAVMGLATQQSPEAVVGPIEGFWRENSDGPVAQIHVFAFGGLKKASEWLVDRGSWDIKTSLYGNMNDANAV